MSSYLLNGRCWPLPNARVGCHFNTHQLVWRESFQEVLVCVNARNSEVCRPIVVVEIDCVIYNDAIGSVGRLPFNEQRVSTGVSHYYIGGGICRYCKEKSYKTYCFSNTELAEQFEITNLPMIYERQRHCAKYWCSV